MGWLWDQMGAMEEPARSLRELAKRLQRSRHWPKGERIKPESLATYLGQLDKGQSEWFSQRPGVCLALADILGMTREDLDERLGGTLAGPRRLSNLIKLWDLDTRPLDLRTEFLPPGLPTEVLEPRSWPRWWQAPSGSGRTLVGQWLEARGLAVFIQAESWSEAVLRLPSRGPVFVELTRSTELPSEPPLYLSICLAVDAPCPGPVGFLFYSKPGWAGVQKPSGDAWLEELVRWIAPRLSPEYGFDSSRCLEWLRRVPLALGLIEGFGDALGFAGLFVEFGGGHSKSQRRLLEQASSPSALARLFLRLRLLRAAHEEGRVSRDVLWNSLLRLAKGLLHGSGQPWLSARPLDAWYELAHARPDSYDLGWLEELAARKKLPLGARELEVLRRELPPDTFHTVQLLRRLRLLHEVTPGRFTIRPPWFLQALVDDMSARLLDEAVESWGGVLLRRHGMERVLLQLAERCGKGDFTPIQQLLDEPKPQEPFWVAALEAAFRVLGLLVLKGGVVPERIGQEIFHTQQALAIELEGYPYPRIDYTASAQLEGVPLLFRGLWYLAAFALSESLGERLSGAPPLLSPWSGEAPCEALYEVLNHIELACFHERGDQSVLRNAVLLGGRLLDRLGPIPGPDDMHVLQAPEQLLRIFQEGRLEWMHLDNTAWLRCFGVLPDYCEQRGVSWKELARAVWSAWVKSKTSSTQYAKFPKLFWIGTAWDAALWAELPREAVQLLVEHYAWEMGGKLKATPFFREEHWMVFFSTWKQKTAERAVLSELKLVWRDIPPRALGYAIREGLLHEPSNQEPCQVFWERAPGMALEAMVEWIHQGLWLPSLRLALSVPEQQEDAFLDCIEAELGRADLPMQMLINVLHERVGLGGRSWRRAWDLLQRLTQARRET